MRPFSSCGRRCPSAASTPICLAQAIDAAARAASTLDADGLAADQALELRHDLEQIAHQAHVGDFEDRRFAVLVDGHDGARVLDAGQMLNRAGDADGDVDVGRDDLARSGPTCISFGAYPASTAAREAPTAAPILSAKLNSNLKLSALPRARPPDTTRLAVCRSGPIGGAGLGSDIARVRGQRDAERLGFDGGTAAGRRPLRKTRPAPSRPACAPDPLRPSRWRCRRKSAA